jgi:aspartate-semialdehyde dehydrogenase
MPSGQGTFHRVAIVGASSLRGKELKQVLEDRHFPASEVILLDESVRAGTLTEAAGEPTFIRALEEDSFEGARFVFFAGTAEDAERNWRVAQSAGATVIDLTGALAAGYDRAPSIAWIPSLASALPLQTAPGSNGAARPAAYSSPATPVIIACTLAGALAPLQTRRTVLLMFPPVSERDQEGIEELESQTASLLSFREAAQPVFDAQVAFNLLARYGESSKTRLADMRGAIARDAARYLAGRAAVPAIQLVQAPVFYGYAFAAYAEFAPPGSLEQVEAAFGNLGVTIAGPDDASPTNVSVAGENEIHLAPIEPDPNVEGGFWLWGVADNLRLAATNAVRIAEELVAQSK